MARTQAPGRHRGRAPSRRRPPLSWVRRNSVWLVGAALASVAVIVVASRGGESGNPGDTGGSAAGFTGGDFHSLVADPTRPGRLLVGGHQAVSASNDGGRTWSRLGSLDDADAMGWAFTKDAIWVSGHPGINRSTDGATSFEKADDGLPDTDVHAFGANDSALYASSPSVGVFASTDGGRSWEVRTERAGQSFFGRILVVDDGASRLVAADTRAGAVESTDGGRTWRRLGGPSSAAWVSRSGDALHVSGPQGSARTRDGGRTWEGLDLPEGASLVEADPADPQVLYAGVHQGDVVRAWVSRDGGKSWTRP